MNWLDIILIVILAMAVFGGLKNGLIKGVLGLAGIIVGVVLAGIYYVALAENLTFIAHEGAAKLTAFAIIFIVVLIIAAVIGIILSKIASAIMLGWLNRLLGGVLGLVIGVVFCGSLLATWARFLGTGGIVEDSALAGFLLNSFPLVLALLPSEFDSVSQFFH